MFTRRLCVGSGRQCLESPLPGLWQKLSQPLLLFRGGRPASGAVSWTPAPVPHSPHPALYRNRSQVLMVPPGSCLPSPRPVTRPDLPWTSSPPFYQTGDKSCFQPFLLSPLEPPAFGNLISCKNRIEQLIFTGLLKGLK